MAPLSTSTYGVTPQPAMDYDWYTIRIPKGTRIDGAVVELGRQDGTITADVRINGPEQP